MPWLPAQKLGRERDSVTIALNMAGADGYLVFSTGESLFGLPASHASEVVTVPALTRVPGAGPHVLGVFEQRGEVVPLIDFQALLGSKAPHMPVLAKSRAIVLRVERGSAALTVKQVLGVMPVTVSGNTWSERGVEAHLKGPGSSSSGDVSVIDAQGLFEFLCAMPR
jgi:chemotaxis signal transduction protein